MSDEREPDRYDPLRETQRQVAEEEEKRRADELAEEQNAPEARLAAFEAELAEKVRLGRITGGDMAYALRRFENALIVEANIEDARHARDEEAAQNLPARGPEGPAEGLSQTSAGTEGVQDELPERGEITDARAARLARLRDITARLRKRKPRED